MDFSKVGLSLVGLTCVTLALLLVAMAAPSRRAPAGVLAGLLAVAGLVAFVRAARMKPLEHSSQEPIGTAIPDPEEFLGSIPQREELFWRWASGKRLVITDELQLLDVVSEHADDIYADDRALLVPAIAAYGELVKKRINGDWFVSWTRPGRELVIARRYRPWTRRRVIYELLDALSG